MADTSPAFQWYPKDALSSVRLSMLTLAEEGAYRRALDYCWLHGSIPADPNKLIRLIGKGCTLKIAEAIIPMFEEKDGQLYHERLEQERNKQKAFRDKQAENGRRGGRPKKETQEKGLGYFGETQTEAKKTSSVSNLQSSYCNTISKDIDTPVQIEIQNLPKEQKQKDPQVATIPPELAQLNEWLKENAPTVLKMSEQLTYDQYQKLFTKYHNTEILGIFQAMHNYAPLLKKSKSVFLTANSWLNRDKERNQPQKKQSGVSKNVQSLMDYAKRNP